MQMRCSKYPSLQLARSSCSAVPSANDFLQRASVALMRASTTAQPQQHDDIIGGSPAGSSTSNELSPDRP